MLVVAPVANKLKRVHQSESDDEEEESDEDEEAGMKYLDAKAIAAGATEAQAAAGGASGGSGAGIKKKRAKKEGKTRIQVTKQFIDACLCACDVQSVKANALTSRNTAQTAWSSVKHDFRVNHHPDPSKKKKAAPVIMVRGKSTLEYAFYLLIASNAPDHMKNMLDLIKVLLKDCKVRPPSMENREAFDAFLEFITVTATRAARSSPELVDESPTALWRRRFMFVSLLLKHTDWLDSAASVAATLKAFIGSGRFEMVSALMQNAQCMALLAPQDCFDLVVYAMRYSQPYAVKVLLANATVGAALTTATFVTRAGETLLHLDARHMDGEFAPRLLELQQDPTVQCSRGQHALAILTFVGDGNKELSDKRKAAAALHENAMRVIAETRATQAKYAAALNAAAGGGAN